MPRRDLTRVVVLCAFALAAACSRRYLVADAGVMISGDARDGSDAVAVADGRASDSGITDAPQAIDVPPAIDARPAIDVPPADRRAAGRRRGVARLSPSCAQHRAELQRPAVRHALLLGDAEPSNCSIRCECRGQSWICDRPCTTGACPGSPPISLATCSTPNLRCSYATGCAPRELMCMTFEVGAQGSWVCVAGCGPCDAGVDGPVDGGVDAVADAARDAIGGWRRRWRQRHPVRHRPHLFRHRHLRDVEPVRRPGGLPGRARWWRVSGGIDAEPQLSDRETGLRSRLPGSELSAACRGPPPAAPRSAAPACPPTSAQFTSCISAQGRNVFCANS